MVKFKIGDKVAFKEHQTHGPNQMTVGKSNGSPYCECFYFTEGRILHWGVFPAELLKKVDEGDGFFCETLG